MRVDLWIRVPLIVGVIAGSVQAAEPTSGPAESAASRPVELPSPDAVQRAIRQLNHPLPAKRQEAVRQLSLWGPLAFEHLEQVAAGADLESALLARDLLREMGEVLFVGAQVRLEADRTRIRWDEPVALTVEVRNPNEGNVRVPWPARADLSASQPAEDDTRQVAAVMDVADFISVTDPGGEAVDLRVDPIEQDTAIYRVVGLRASDTPPSHAIGPGATVRLAVRQFNRGWARFPMLARGKYHIQFEYQPEWKDPTWTAQGVGRIRSNVVEIEVIDEAPAQVRQAVRPLAMDVSLDGDRVRGELRNTWDRDVYVNLNVGANIETHARLEWVPQRDSDEANPFMLPGDATEANFSVDRVKQLAPGQAVIVSRASRSQIVQQAQPTDSARSEQIWVRLRYAHLASPDALRRTLRDKGRHESVPTQLFTGMASSDPIRVDDAR
jgi:hypothetical protein